MNRFVSVQGTGWSRRPDTIREFCTVGGTAVLARDFKNPYDPNAIIVYLLVPRFPEILGKRRREIGYVDNDTALSLARHMNSDGIMHAIVHRCQPGSDDEKPQVVLELLPQESPGEH
jgi:hypothetical protein